MNKKSLFTAVLLSAVLLSSCSFASPNSSPAPAESAAPAADSAASEASAVSTPSESSAPTSAPDSPSSEEDSAAESIPEESPEPSLYHEESAEEKLTEKELADLEKADTRIRELLDSEAFEQAEQDERRRLISPVLAELAEAGYIIGASVLENDDGFSFQYSSGVLGGISLKSWGGDSTEAFHLSLTDEEKHLIGIKTVNDILLSAKEDDGIGVQLQETLFAALKADPVHYQLLEYGLPYPETDSEPKQIALQYWKKGELSRELISFDGEEPQEYVTKYGFRYHIQPGSHLPTAASESRTIPFSEQLSAAEMTLYRRGETSCDGRRMTFELYKAEEVVVAAYFDAGVFYKAEVYDSSSEEATVEQYILRGYIKADLNMTFLESGLDPSPIPIN